MTIKWIKMDPDSGYQWVCGDAEFIGGDYVIYGGKVGGLMNDSVRGDPSSKLASAIMDMAERDKGLTHASLLDLINQSRVTWHVADYVDAYEEGFEKGAAQALEERENRVVDQPDAAKRHTDGLTRDEADEVRRRLELKCGYECEIVQEKCDMSTQYGVAVRLKHRKHIRTAVREVRSWSTRDIAEQLAKDLAAVPELRK